MKCTIVGTGYVGLVTGACLAKVGINVNCIDINEDKINKLKNGIIPIYEPGLEEIVEETVKNGKLKFDTELKNNLDVDVVFIAVGTPPDEDGSADLSYVLGVAREIGKYMKKYLVVVTKSTVPVGTAQLVKQSIQEELDNYMHFCEFDIASNPEFLKEGSAIDDFMKPDRIVVGVESERAQSILERMYRPFTLNGHPIYFMDVPSAEMTKYAANAMLATKISFINDIANLCSLVGADINMVRRGICSDTRIGNKFLYPGIGYGGSCFPKDVKALIKTAKENFYDLKVLQAVEEVNEYQKHILFYKIFNYFGQELRNKKIAIWGLSFKPETDDMRESPSLVIINDLLEYTNNIVVYDPVAMEEGKRILGNKVVFVDDQYDALKDVDCIVLVTEWKQFRVIDYSLMKKLMKEYVIFDGRNVYNRKEVEEEGFKYFCI